MAGGLVTVSIHWPGLVGITSMGSGPGLTMSVSTVLSMTTTLCDTKLFIIGTRGVTIGTTACAASAGLTGTLLCSGFGGLGGPGPGRALLHDIGGSVFILEVVLVVTRHVLTLGCNTPIGLRPTWGLVMGPHIGLFLYISSIQSATAVLRACLGW